MKQPITLLLRLNPARPRYAQLAESGVNTLLPRSDGQQLLVLVHDLLADAAKGSNQQSLRGLCEVLARRRPWMAAES